MEDVDKILSESKKKMEGALHALDEHFNTVRTGRANPALLDNVMVEAYGSQMPLNQVANVMAEDARSIIISPYDKGQMSAIERAIIIANLGLTPNNNGSVIRIGIPPLTEERRKELVKQTHKMAEEARVAVRHVRKHANDEVKKIDGLPEDSSRGATEEIQKLTDQFIKKVDDRLQKKEKDIMEV
ncbi:MAG: ribosome recycling factor [Sumerlaeia bacterium]